MGKYILSNVNHIEDNLFDMLSITINDYMNMVKSGGRSILIMFLR